MPRCRFDTKSRLSGMLWIRYNSGEIRVNIPTSNQQESQSALRTVEEFNMRKQTNKTKRKIKETTTWFRFGLHKIIPGEQLETKAKVNKKTAGIARFEMGDVAKIGTRSNRSS